MARFPYQASNQCKHGNSSRENDRGVTH